MFASLLAVLLALPAAAAPTEAAGGQEAQRHYLRATLLERRGAYAEALAEFEKALELDPQSAFLAGEAAELALEVEDWERAEKWARRRLELAPKDAKSQLALGRVQWAKGRIPEAEKSLEKALELDPKNADTVFGLVELVAPKDPKRARAILTKFLKDDPEQAAATWLELGKLDAQEEKYPEAAEKLRRAIALDDGESAPARLMLGQVYEVLRDTRAAIAEYRWVLSVEPEEYELWARIGELEALAGDLDAARDTFKRLKEKRPDDAAACSWLASDAERRGDFAAAAAVLKDSAALKDDATLHLRLGHYLLQSGGIKEAMKALSAARARWPKDDRIGFYLALGHDDLGEHAKAVELLREVLAVKPADRDARWQLATILEKMGRVEEAEPEFRRLIDERPDDATALNYLGYALADRGLKLDEAEALIRRAVAVEPYSAAFRDSLGWVLHKQGRSTEAVAQLEAATRSLPDDPTLLDHLASARNAAGDETGAWRAWRLAQSHGLAKAGAAADALQKDWDEASLGEAWRRHLALTQGGLKRYAGLCELRGKIAGRGLTHRALFTWRAPGELSFELLGPMFSTAWRARLDDGGFAMDRLAVDGVPVEQVEEAAHGLFAAVSSALSGGAFAPGPAKLTRGWGRRSLERAGWRADLGEQALARSIQAEGAPAVSLFDFVRSGARRAPRTLSAEGRFWELALVCPEPKVEFEPAEAP
ncbi:MAG: tetratricopeptide repeat protein [Elusimicrobiota bacterium]|nr:tetratricopeptide repeat protein [Elusimicrobiota bacterium]